MKRRRMNAQLGRAEHKRSDDSDSRNQDYGLIFAFFTKIWGAGIEKVTSSIRFFESPFMNLNMAKNRNSLLMNLRLNPPLNRTEEKRGGGAGRTTPPNYNLAVGRGWHVTMLWLSHLYTPLCKLHREGKSVKPPMPT